MRNNLQTQLQWLRQRQPLPKYSPPRKRWRPNELEDVIQKFDAAKAIRGLQNQWTPSVDIGKTKKPSRKPEREFGTLKPQTQRKSSFQSSFPTVKKQKLNSGAPKKTFMKPEPRDKRKSRSSIGSVGSDSGSQATQNSFSIEQSHVFSSASMPKKKITPVFGSKKKGNILPPCAPKFSPSLPRPPKKSKAPSFQRRPQKPEALPPRRPFGSSQKPKTQPVRNSSFQQSNVSFSQGSLQARKNNPPFRHSFQSQRNELPSIQSFQSQRNDLPSIQSFQSHRNNPPSIHKFQPQRNNPPSIPQDPEEETAPEVITAQKYVMAQFDLRDALYAIVDLPPQMRQKGSRKRKGMEMKLKIKREEIKELERNHGKCLDEMKDNMEDDWDEFDVEISFVKKIIDMYDRGSEIRPGRLKKMEDKRRTGDAFKDHLFEMMYDNDEEETKPESNTAVLNHNPPLESMVNANNSHSSSSNFASNLSSHSVVNAHSNSFNSINSSMNSTWGLDQSLPNASAVQPNRSFMSAPEDSFQNNSASNQFMQPTFESNQFIQPPIEHQHHAFENGDGDAKPWESKAVSSNQNGHINNVKSHKFNVTISRWTNVHDFDDIMLQELEDHWSYTNFRPMQREIITAALKGKDVFAILPTGSGKSLCYQLPAVVEKKTTVVISPLLALIEDQVWELEQVGVNAASVGSQHDFETNKETLKKFAHGDLGLLYCTPEKLVQNNYFQHCISKLRDIGGLGRFVIDEAHCASQWGHDFRQEYTQLDIIRKTWPEIPILALTATASETVKSEVASILRIPHCEYFQHTFNRPNIRFSVVAKQKNPVDQIVELIQARSKQCGIVYCLAVKEVEKLYGQIMANGIKVTMYHGQMETEHRSQNHQMWKNGRVDVIVATVAFGMGINKPDVRYVIHATIPKSIEDYYQQAGRAGRDGRPSEAIVMYGGRDRFRCSFIIKMPNREDGRMKPKQRIEMEMARLWDMVLYCTDDVQCRRSAIMGYFGESFGREKCNKTCDTCENPKRLTDVDFTEHAKQVLTVVKKCKTAAADFNSRLSKKSTFTLTLSTTSRVEKIMRGNKDKFFEKCGVTNWPEYGAMKKRPVHELKRLMFTLLKEGYLSERTELTNKGGMTSELTLKGKGRSMISNDSWKNKNAIILRVAGGKVRARKSPLKKQKELARPIKRLDEKFEMKRLEHIGYTDEMQSILFERLKRDVRATLACGGTISRLFPDEDLWNMTCILPVEADELVSHCKCKKFPVQNYGLNFLTAIFDFMTNNSIQRVELPELDPLKGLSQCAYKKPDASSEDFSDFEESDFTHGTHSKKKKKPAKSKKTWKKGKGKGKNWKRRLPRS